MNQCQYIIRAFALSKVVEVGEDIDKNSTSNRYLMQYKDIITSIALFTLKNGHSKKSNKNLKRAEANRECRNGSIMAIMHSRSIKPTYWSYIVIVLTIV